MDPRSPKDSQTELSSFMHPEDANSQGNVHGGSIMKLVDEAGALAAMRHSRRPCVTVAIDSMTFDAPMLVGDLVVLEACVTYVGRTSIEAMVTVYAEKILTGQRMLTNTAFVVYVALDDQRRPTEVAPLLLVSEQEKRRFDQGRARQQERLARARRDKES
ncbi:MAG: acyl-CoA thioesterase [Anaerolineae bacterium]|uniref:acyl-CoA thioesterase n=1 Tax=Candidatus Amarolinea dominans TaxID=3140696 RepID=UPI0031370CBC|nr:acyl-CoA thioesterase [Anaerolineae bacterium]